MWKSLIWKEWREQRWRIALGSVTLIGMTVILLRTRVLPDKAFVVVTAVLSAVLFPMFVASALVAPERSGHTLTRLLGLPVPAWKIAVIKMAVGLGVCGAPFVLTCAIVCAVAGGREERIADIITAYVVATAFGWMWLLWFLTVGLRPRREDTAVLAGMAVLGFWAVQGIVVDDLRIEAVAGQWIWHVNPFAIADLLDYPGSIQAVLATQGLVAAVLVAWIVTRFGRMQRRGL